MGRYAWEKTSFKDREEAAKLLAEKLGEYRGLNPLVLAIPRGAIRMGRIIADALHGDLDVVLVHKLGAPDNPELAVGAVSEKGEVYLAPYAAALHIPERFLNQEADRQMGILKQRRKIYTPFRTPYDADKRVVIIVDDGIATGSTILAAIRAVRHEGPLKIVVAAAVAPPDTVEVLRREADEVVVLAREAEFGAVGEFFQDFRQVTDEEVVETLKQGHGSKKG
jgi:putative phosphoribosyl transferase